MPVGNITRGTTNTNRLRRVDRWIAELPVLRSTPDPLVVDLGYGASGVTALELQQRLAKARPDVPVRPPSRPMPGCRSGSAASRCRSLAAVRPP
jgi:hypothetical protein